MSRLSLKPGGEPGMWVVSSDTLPLASMGFRDVPDTDLIAIQRTLMEYFEGKAEPVEEKPKLSLWKRHRGKFGWLTVGYAIAMAGFCFGWSQVPDAKAVVPSTGGVIDQLCMRPDSECSTSIRYLHPQGTGITIRPNGLTVAPVVEAQ